MLRPSLQNNDRNGLGPRQRPQQFQPFQGSGDSFTPRCVQTSANVLNSVLQWQARHCQRKSREAGGVNSSTIFHAVTQIFVLYLCKEAHRSQQHGRSHDLLQLRRPLLLGMYEHNLPLAAINISNGLQTLFSHL